MTNRVTDLEIYNLAEVLSDRVWKIVIHWADFEQKTIGHNLMRAVDSISLNIAEGFGRYSYRDSLRFSIIARGSFEETKAALRKCWRRKLIMQQEIDELAHDIDALGPRLNAFINKQRDFISQDKNFKEPAPREYSEKSKSTFLDEIGGSQLTRIGESNV